MPGPQTENLEECVRWLRASYDHCLRQGMVFTSLNCTRALKELNAPFTTCGALRRYGLRFRDIHRHFVYGHELQSPREFRQGGATSADAQARRARAFKHETEELEITPEEAWDRLMRRSEHVIGDAEAHQQHTVRIDRGGPIGLVLLGDVHIGSGACDTHRFQWTTDLILRDHVPIYTLSIGDLLDNMHWHPGEMAKSGSPISVHVAAAQHWIDLVADRLIAIVSGNHENWTASKTGIDLLQHVFLKAGWQVPYHPLQMILDLEVGQVTYRGLLRHAMPGGSQYNTAHAPLRFGLWHDTKHDADFYVCGHVHKSGYLEREMHGRARHCIQLGAFKNNAADGYAVKHGFPDLNTSPEMFMILHPDRKEIEVYPKAEQGLRMLEALWSPERSSRRSSTAKRAKKSKARKSTSSRSSTKTTRSSTSKATSSRRTRKS